MRIAIGGLLVALVSHVVWAYAATFAVAALKAKWPDEYLQVGRPSTFDIWFSRAVGTPFDDFTMTREFRRSSIKDRDVLRMLETAFFFRWLELTGFGAAVFGIFAALG